MYTMTGLYSETADDSSIDVPADSENSEFSCPLPMNDAAAPSNYVADTVIKCHSRQPSTGIIDQREKDHDSDLDMSSVDCGILNCRPKSFQKFARIKVYAEIEKNAGFVLDEAELTCSLLFLIFFADFRATTIDVGDIATGAQFWLH